VPDTGSGLGTPPVHAVSRLVASTHIAAIVPLRRTQEIMPQQICIN
jgi:hypothetical protein